MTDINIKKIIRSYIRISLKVEKFDLERLIKDIHSNTAIFNHISKSN